MTKKFWLLFFSSLVIFISTSEVHAEEISYKRIDGVYYNQWVNGNLNSNHVTMFYFGDTLAYCIEPGVAINDKNYNSTKDWGGTSFSEEQKSMMEKIGYYGYEYPGHQSPEYYLAAQELIWNVSNPNIKVAWSSEKNNGGNILNYETQKNEILDLIEKDEIRPSFSNTKITGEVGKSLVIADDNNVLDNYVLSESQYHNLKIENNSLIIDFNKELVPNETITLTRKNYDNQVFIVYTKVGNQAMATLRFSSPVETSFEIENEEIPEIPTPEIPKMPTTETPEIVKVPNTGSDYNYLFSMLCFIGGGLIRVKKIL